jgi:hypothetical protein
MVFKPSPYAGSSAVALTRMEILPLNPSLRSCLASIGRHIGHQLSLAVPEENDQGINAYQAGRHCPLV